MSDTEETKDSPHNETEEPKTNSDTKEDTENQEVDLIHVLTNLAKQFYIRHYGLISV